jgi:hypothetical protein
MIVFWTLTGLAAALAGLMVLTGASPHPRRRPSWPSWTG